MNKNTTEMQGADPNGALDSKTAAAGVRAATLAAAPRIWKSRISWRITLTVFIVILFVQGISLYGAAENFETAKLTELKQLARAVIGQHIANDMSADVSAGQLLPRTAAERIIANGPVKGLTIYNLDHSLLATYGESATLRSQALTRKQAAYRSADLSRYEVIFSSSEIGIPFHIVATLDALTVEPALQQYIRDAAVMFILMAGLVTSILMLALEQWLLRPMLTLRGNLLNAAENPKNPEIHGTGKEGRDEIGITLRIANGLIRKNAANLEQMERQTEEKIHKLAYYDTLTGLPNRIFFMEKLDEAIHRRVIREGKRLTVFSINIDHFSDLNNTMGHEIGDRILEAVGRRLAGALPADALVARISADEFSVMTILGQNHETDSVALERILQSFVEPVNILQEKFQVRVSIGVATAPGDGTTARDIIKNADIALTRAKLAGRDTVRRYSDDLELLAHKRFQLLTDLHAALDNGHLMLHFQPQFDLAKGVLIGAEALLRWKRLDNSAEGSHIVPPEEFMQIAEQTGLIVPIGEWVLRKACQTNKMWQDQGGLAVCVAVNISAAQFHHGDIVRVVARILQETGMAARYLELEIKEGVFMENMDVSADILRELHEMGVRLSVDDFGTGFSSLSSLRLLPVDRLKIDPSFVRNALVNTEDAAIVKTIITLGRSLGIKVMAEGVETSYHVAFLRKEGCDEAQGFRYSQPLEADKFVNYAAAYNRDLVRASLHIVKDAS